MTTRVQGGRTATPASPPANNSLQPGELYVEMASPLRLWTGVPTSVTASGVKLIVDATAQAAANSSAVQKAGDTMTGPLVLSGSPTQPNQAANKAYADTKVATVAGHPGPDVVLTHTDISDWTASLAPYAPLASPPLTGNPTAPTPAPGDNDTSIATTAFVATAISAQPGTVIAPTTPAFKAGQLWWDATGGSLYVGYDDGSTQQYVPATNITLPANVATKADVATAQNNVGRNLIHNSAFTIAQRGAGPWTTSSYTLDRWSISTTLDGISITRQVLADADRTAIGDEAAIYAFQNVFTGNAGASAYHNLAQNIEGIRRLAGKTVAFSFWAKAASGTPKLGLNMVQNFGTGGSPSAAAWINATGQAVTLSTTWTRYVVTFAVPSSTGKTLGTNGDDNTGASFFFSSGATVNSIAGNIGVQSGTVQLWGVQLEIAQPGQTQPTPLEKRDPVLELQQCQRFYQFGYFTMGAYGTTTAANTGYGTFPVTMRATPQVTISNQTYTNASGATVYYNNAQQFSCYANTTATGFVSFQFNWQASADL